MAHKNENWVGGSFHNSTILATVNEIISVLGESDCQDNTGRGKTNFDWNGITESGIEFTVYDWKEGRPIGLNEKIRFHIGGNSFMETSDAKQELIEDIQKAKQS